MHSNVTAMVIQSHQDPSKRDVRSNCRQWTKLISCTWHNNKFKKQLGLLKVIQNGPTFWLAIYPWTFCQQLNFGTACRSNCRHRTKLIGCTWWAVRYLLLTISIKADSYALLFPDQISRPWSYHIISKSNSLFMYYFIFWVPSSYHGFNSISHEGSQGRFEKCHYVTSWLAKSTEDEEELTLLMLIIIVMMLFCCWHYLSLELSLNYFFP